MRNISNSSTDSGSTSAGGLGGSTTALAGGGGRGPVGAGAGTPLTFGISMVEAAISSNLEVAASSLRMIVVSSILETVGTTLSSMMAVDGVGS